jgi:hypothetical protein
MSRSDAVKELSAMLHECCRNDNSGNYSFLAQQVLADVEEFFVDPFGSVDPDAIVAGFGAQKGLEMLINGGGAKKLGDAVRSIIEYVGDNATETQLKMMGLERCSTSSFVCNRVNGRIFNATDAEHILCKVWVVAKLTLGHYRNSRCPKTAKPHCHPMKLAKDEEPYCKFVPEIMSDIKHSYAECCSVMEQTSNYIVPPHYCYLPGESNSSP